MSNTHRESEALPDVPVCPLREVQIVGLDIISHSDAFVSLFSSCKKWILSLWENCTDQIENITICKKVIGRNGGFVVKVNCFDNVNNSVFYVKVQPASMDTVLIHHLLKNMKCGPERFHIVVLEGKHSKYFGVITEGVKDWTMASALTRAQKNLLVNEKQKLISTAFLLTLLIELGRFNNIPNNKDNWGFVEGHGETIPYPHMSLVDFSRGLYCRDTFCTRASFLFYWEENVEYLYKKWQPECGDFEDLQLFKNQTNDLYQSLKRGINIADQIHHFSFLQSCGAFIDILQITCDESLRWLADVVKEARSKPVNFGRTSAVTTLHCGGYVVTAFPGGSQPDVSGLVGPYKTLLCEYVSLVNEWNMCVSSLLVWFPFPMEYDNLAVTIESTASEEECDDLSMVACAPQII